MIEQQTTDPRSVPQLIADLTSDMSTLFRKEVQLLRAEIAEKGRDIGRAAAEAAIGAVLLLVAVIFVMHAVALALADAIGPVGGYLVVGVGLAALGAFAVSLALKTAKPENLKLARTTRQARETIEVAKEQTR